MDALESCDPMFRRLFDEMPCSGAVLDEQRVVIAANRCCAENHESAVGRPCHEVFLGRAEPCVDCPVSRTVEEGCAHSGPEGSDAAACLTIPARDSAGGAFGVIHFFRSGGEAARLQKALVDYDCLFGAAAHGLKGCLTGMGGGVYMCNTGVKLDKPERVEKGFPIINRNFRRMQSIAHHVLYYLRDREFSPEPLDAVEVLKKTADDHADEAEFLNTRIVVSEDLPAEAAMTVDRKAIESALINLLATSLDNCRSDARDIEHESRLSMRVEGGSAVFEMADNGNGLTPEELDELLGLFDDPRPLTPPDVGLYVVNKLAGLLGGSLEVESRREHGTTYRLTIPLQPGG